MLHALDCDVMALRDEFPPNITDEQYLAAIAGRDMVLLTGDRGMLRRPQELRALKSANLTVLFLGPFWSKLGFWKQAEWLVRHWPKLAGFAAGAAKGTFAEVSQGGRCRPFQV